MIPVPDPYSRGIGKGTDAPSHVVRGAGATIVNGTRYDWGERDFFVVPPWAWHEHLNGSGKEPAILFHMDDSPAMRALDFYREESCGANEGRQ